MISGERGQSVSVYVVGLLPALLLAVGLAVDGGAQLAATRELEVLAAQAARAGTDAASTARLAGQSGESAARAEAARVVATRPGTAATVTFADGRVTVDTSTRVPTLFLSAAGIGTLPAHGHAESDLRRI